MTLSRFTRISLSLFVLAHLAACEGNGGTDPGATTGAISGTVTANGSGVAGADLALATGTSVTTLSSGQYRFDDLQPGGYALTLTPPAGLLLPAGQSASRTVTVAAGATTTANWTLVSEDPDDDVVEIRLTTANRFSPADVTIPAGTTVRWINDSNMLHTVTPDDPQQVGVWSAVTTSSQGVALEHTFTAGDQVYDYHCEPHLGLGMVGRITVQ